MSSNLVERIRLDLDQLAIVRSEMEPLIARAGDSELTTLERAAASAMLHSFYTQVEKMMEAIAEEWGPFDLAPSAWHS